MKVVYDISVLGAINYWSLPKTGIYRYVANIAKGLIMSKECDIIFCSSALFEITHEVLEYLKPNSKFNQIPFIYPKDICFKISHNLRRFIKISKIENLKILNRFLYYIVKLIEFNVKPLKQKELFGKDIFHSTYFSLPEESKNIKNLKRFLTVHDLYPILYPQFYRFNKDHFLRHTLKSLCQNDYVICQSYSTKNDLCNYLKIDPLRVFVIYPGVDSNLFYHVSNYDKILYVKKKYHIKGDYILSVNSFAKRKNVFSVIRCFARLVEDDKFKDLNLVLVGAYNFKFNEIFREINKYDSIENRIILTGYVPDEDLSCLYSGAICFLYPSFYEGFVFPVLEAMQCGVPVITSNISSLPEIVGDAGITISPTDDEALYYKLYEILTNTSLRQSLSLKSITRAKQFSWEKCVSQIIEAYKIALRN